jgi:lipoprotein NlpD
MERMIRVAVARRFLAVIRGRYFGACFLLSIAALFLPVGCANSQVQKTQASGVYHIVKKGETLYSIARAYSASLQELAEINNIDDVASIREGSVIFIPNADQVIEDVMVSAGKAAADAGKEEKVKDIKPSSGEKPLALVKPLPSQEKAPQVPAGPAKPPRAETVAVLPAAKPDKTGLTVGEKMPVVEEKVVMEKSRFAWPVRGTVKTRFGIQPNKTYHNWIKIACPAGTRVKAAASGTVIFSANLKDFGETVIIRHANDFATVYTHLRKRSVRADQDVGKGQTIGHAGRTDEAGETYFNFEIRIKGKARNPLFYLP